MALESIGIVAWPRGDRPRERLLRMGPQALTESETFLQMEDTYDEQFSG